MLQCTGLVVPVNHYEHFFSIHHSTNTYCQSSLGHLIHIVIKESTISYNGISCESFLTRATCKAWTRLIKGYMSVGANASHKQINAACCLNCFLIIITLCLKVRSIAIQDMHVLLFDVYMAEEIVPHERVVTFRMLLGQIHIFIHIECDNILERHLASFVQSYEFLIQS